MTEEKDIFDTQEEQGSSSETPAVEQTDGVPEEEAPSVPAKKVFSRKDIVKSVDVKVHLPDLYPGYEPWCFKFRLKLSGEADERRQEYFALSPAKQTEQHSERILDEVCDLLVELPTGFAELDKPASDPGRTFRQYVESSDNHARAILDTIVEGANTRYWQIVSPREFRG